MLQDYLEISRKLKEKMYNYIRTDLSKMFDELKILYPEI